MAMNGGGGNAPTLETNLVIDRPLKFRVDDAIDPATVSAAAFGFTNVETGDVIPVDVSTPDDRTIIVTPGRLDPGRYVISIRDVIKNRNGGSVLGPVDIGAVCRAS